MRSFTPHQNFFGINNRNVCQSVSQYDGLHALVDIVTATDAVAAAAAALCACFCMFVWVWVCVVYVLHGC